MRCKLDENIPLEALDLVRASAHDCHSVVEEKLGGAADGTVYDRCRREGRVLLTLDLDFGDIRTYPPQESPGVIVVRPDEPNRDRVLHLIRQALVALRHESVAQSLWVVEESRIRIRRAGEGDA